METPVPYVVVHHGGIAHYCHDQKSCSAIVRSYQNYHIDDRGWFDIGYSFVIGEDGNAYEGRGWDKVGAHAPGYNSQSIGICVIGDFSDVLPNEAALDTLNKLIEYGISLGKISENYHVVGHRQINCLFGIQFSIVRPNIISRAQWGAKSPKIPISNLATDPPPYVVIHHSATDSCTMQAICQARARSFQNYHMNDKDWSDIGYNFLVGEDGNVYEGRGWGKHGAHSTPYNSRSIGICLIGNFVGHEPNAAAIKATQSLIAYGVSIGKIQENYTLLGHRQITSTSCPGDSLYRLIQSWSNWSPNV
ncbi:Peptidoglycan recognition protein 3 [Dufourea novaeangliae]|uniref:Peptidoglycan recognition protein 3 n=1 Tax=Dufourea novaeangliae TaxID=178035 RepID=A0A154P5R0_DUFNO|nr:Peptidoglycan recognition protein 3 [Dufourea novaeangliae]